MGLLDFLRKKSSLDKVREELQILNKKLSTSMSFLEVEEEVQFLKEMTLGANNDYSLREKHYKNVITFWFKGLLAEHEVLVVKKIIEPFGKDETIKAFLQFTDCFRRYLVNEGLLKEKKSSGGGGGITTTLEDLYMKTFKSYEDEKNKEENEDDKKEKKKLPKKSKEEKTEVIENNDKKFEGLNRERESEGREKEASEESYSKEESVKESSSNGEVKSNPTNDSITKDNVEKIGPETKIADKAQKIALGINNKDQSSKEKSISNDEPETKKEETIYGRNAYNVMQERLSQIQGERAELATERMKMEESMNRNKDFMRDLKEWRKENDKKFLGENRENNRKALENASKEALNEKGSNGKSLGNGEKQESIYDRNKRKAQEAVAKQAKAIDKLFNKTPENTKDNKENVFKTEADFGAEYREKLEQVKLAQEAEAQYERNRAEAFKAIEKERVQVTIEEDNLKPASPVVNKKEDAPVVSNDNQLVK